MAQITRLFFAVITFFILFNATNVNPTLAFIYLGFLIVGILLFERDPNVSFPIERTKTDRFKNLVLFGLGGWAVFLVVSFALIFTLNSFIGLTGQLSLNAINTGFAQVEPFLAKSTSFTILNYGFLIPFVETFAFIVLMEVIADAVGISINIRSTSSHIIFALVSGIFTFFHITALGLPAIIGGQINNVGLISTFIFMYTSLFITALPQVREQRPAIGMHIFANLVGVLKRLGVFSLLGA